jgi:hypothetical protein
MPHGAWAIAHLLPEGFCMLHLRPLPSGYLRSLLFAFCLGFLLPMLLIGSVWLGLTLIARIPPLFGLGSSGLNGLVAFLQTFGSGSAWSGLFVLGLTAATAGMMFSTYAVTLERR